MLTGDALSICLNTLAILFLCDVDNLIFAVGLPEHVRARVEEAGRVELDATQAAVLARTKPVHVCLMVAVVLGTVEFTASLNYGGFRVAMNFAEAGVFAFWLGAVVEAFGVHDNAVDTAKLTAGTLLLILLPLVIALIFRFSPLWNLGLGLGLLFFYVLLAHGVSSLVAKKVGQGFVFDVVQTAKRISVLSMAAALGMVGWIALMIFSHVAGLL